MNTLRQDPSGMVDLKKLAFSHIPKGFRSGVKGGSPFELKLKQFCLAFSSRRFVSNYYYMNQNREPEAITPQSGEELNLNQKVLRRQYYADKQLNARRVVAKRVKPNSCFIKNKESNKRRFITGPQSGFEKPRLHGSEYKDFNIHEEENLEGFSTPILNKCDAQFGFEQINGIHIAVDVLSKFANVEMPDKVLKEIEGLALMLSNLTQQTTTTGVVTSILSWAHGRFNTSVTKALGDYIREILVTSQSDSNPSWLQCLRDLRVNWKLCKDNRAFKQISKLLGCLVTLGLCDVANCTFSIGKFKLFSPDITEKHIGALDLADAIFETIAFFVEGAYLCFKTGSLQPLLLNDKAALELDEEYAQICAWFELVQNGNLHKFADMTDQEFENRMNALGTSLRNISHTLKGLDKKLVMDKFQHVLSMQNDFSALKIACGIRHAPWSIELFGESCQGKTTLCDQLLDAVLASQGMPLDKKYRCAYNPADKNMSSWTTDKIVLIFDDVSSDKSQFVERPPTRVILDSGNNQMAYAPKAELSGKGKCFIEPWITVATTNKKDLDAGIYSNCPYAIQRRFTVLTIRAKTMFQRMENGIPCGVDPGLVREYYTTDGVYNPPAFDDIWTITIEVAVRPNKLQEVASYKPLNWKGEDLVDISMGKCIQWAIESFDAHVKNQRALLDSAKARSANITLCKRDGCKHIAGNCPYHDDDDDGEVTSADFERFREEDLCAMGEPHEWEQPMHTTIPIHELIPQPMPHRFNMETEEWESITESDNSSDCDEEGDECEEELDDLPDLDYGCEDELDESESIAQLMDDDSVNSDVEEDRDMHALLSNATVAMQAAHRIKNRAEDDNVVYELGQAVDLVEDIVDNIYSDMKEERNVDILFTPLKTFVDDLMRLVNKHQYVISRLEPHNGRDVNFKMVLPDIDRGYQATRKMYDACGKFVSTFDFITIVPSIFFDNWLFQQVLLFFLTPCLAGDYWRETKKIWSTFVMVFIGTLAFTPFVVAAPTICLVTFTFIRLQFTLCRRIRYETMLKLRRRNYAISPILRQYRDDCARTVCQISVGIAALYALSKAYKSFRHNQQVIQGSLEPDNELEIEQRDAEVNVWTGIVKRDLPITSISKRMSPSHLENVVSKALVYGTIHSESGNGMVNGLMIASNVMVVPDHYFDEFGEEMLCTFRKKNPDASGGKFKVRLHKRYSYLMSPDLRACYVPTGGTYKDLTNFFPLEELPSVPFKLLWRNRNGDMIEARGVSEPKQVRTVKRFMGGMYKTLTMNTFQGLCGATLLSETNGSTIIGIHLGGTAGTPVGCYGSITRAQVEKAREELRILEGVVLTGGAGEFEPEVLGVQFLREDPLHKKSPLNYMPEDSQFEYYGSCIGRSVTKTDVKDTPISPHVESVCGVKNTFHGPKLNPDWFGWQKCLSNMANPAESFPQELLEVAVKDYKESVIPIFKKEIWNKSSPLNDRDNLCGIPGKKFMDAIKLDTSVGYPLSGPKRDHVDELEPTEDALVNRVLQPHMIQEIDRLEQCYRKGERGYPIAKACKKDEVLEKEKCRIFFGNNLPLTFLVRKYYLPILRVLQMNPLLSECAVGINSHGPEWEALHQHITKHGSERTFGGDYGKYDQKLPSQVIIAALRILIDCARECDYGDEDIRIMESMVGDIVYAYIAFNGDLIGLISGGHISGNSLTTIINGICGSLNLRCYFFSRYPPTTFETRKKFVDCVALMTYGDDNVGSVKDGTDFTIKGCSKFLELYGQVYTMPDKTSELRDYLEEDEVEFLKRKSVYHPKLGMHIGALADKSIYKSLHCFMRTKNTVETEEFASAVNIDGALREWFNHGESKYEAQRLMMCEVAERAGISHMCTGLHTTYNERVVEWYTNYGE